jgi:hypothetical protein
MKYLYVLIAIVAIWVGIICIAAIPQPTDSRYELYKAAMIGTGLLFIIGFWRRT